MVGLVNFETFLSQTKAYRRHLREAEYEPLSDPAFLKSISPIYKVDKIETPLMLAHGLNDPRVPVGETMQVAVALKKRGMEVEELYSPTRATSPSQSKSPRTQPSAQTEPSP